MFDALLLGAVRRGSEHALGQLIDKYAAYVCVVIRNTAGERLTREDVEEVASDVFFALWENAGRVEKLKGWLGTTARNKAKNKLREIRDDLPLANVPVSIEDGAYDDTLIRDYEQSAIKTAILLLEPPDREIFTQHYYNSQTVAAIAEETGMTEAAVKQRLVRGREKLRVFLISREVFG